VGVKGLTYAAQKKSTLQYASSVKENATITTVHVEYGYTSSDSNSNQSGLLSYLMSA